MTRSPRLSMSGEEDDIARPPADVPFNAAVDVRDQQKARTNPPTARTKVRKPSVTAEEIPKTVGADWRPDMTEASAVNPKEVGKSMAERATTRARGGRIVQVFAPPELAVETPRRSLDPETA